MTGYLVSGFFSDRYGRRPTIFALACLAAVANLLPLVLHNDLAIMLARFLAGVGADTTCSIVFLLGERQGLRYREQNASHYF